MPTRLGAFAKSNQLADTLSVRSWNPPNINDSLGRKSRPRSGICDIMRIECRLPRQNIIVIFSLSVPDKTIFESKNTLFGRKLKSTSPPDIGASFTTYFNLLDDCLGAMDIIMAKARGPLSLARCYNKLAPRQS